MHKHIFAFAVLKRKQISYYYGYYDYEPLIKTICKTKANTQISWTGPTFLVRTFVFAPVQLLSQTLFPAILLATNQFKAIEITKKLHLARWMEKDMLYLKKG